MTPSTGSSPASCTPSLSVSIQTLSPIETSSGAVTVPVLERELAAVPSPSPVGWAPAGGATIAATRARTAAGVRASAAGRVAGDAAARDRGDTRGSLLWRGGRAGGEVADGDAAWPGGGPHDRKRFRTRAKEEGP